MAEPEEVHAAPAEPEQLSDEQLGDVSGGGPPIIGTLIGTTIGTTGAAGNLATGEHADVFTQIPEPGPIGEGLVAGGG